MNTVSHVDSRFWQGKRVLITGHTGFKGGWLALWLRRMGAEVSGIALPPNTEPNLFHLARLDADVASHLCDIRDAQAVAAIICQARPEVVFHLAAQPLVRASYRDPLGTFSSNIMGTANVLEALRESMDVRVAVAITTDKVYGDKGWPYPYRESDALGGHDPYSASKAACELVISSYRDAYLADRGIALASARAGNVIGGGDWSEDRLIPDAVRAWEGGQVLRIRAPNAIRPWQHVLEPLAGYLALAEKLWSHPELAGPYNFGPLPHTAKTVGEVVDLAQAAYGHGEIALEQYPQQLHESHTLTLETAKSQWVLGTTPRWDLETAVNRTMAWYRAQHQGSNACTLCEADIAAYEAIG